MKVFSNPAIACGSQYSSEASKSTSPSVNRFVLLLSFPILNVEGTKYLS